MFTHLFTHKLQNLKWFIFHSFLETQAAFDKGWSFPDGNQYKNVRYDVFLDLSVLKTSPVNFWFHSCPNLCKTTYESIIIAIYIRSSSIFQNIEVVFR
jgi:hypothetical protein